MSTREELIEETLREPDELRRALVAALEKNDGLVKAIQLLTNNITIPHNAAACISKAVIDAAIDHVNSMTVLSEGNMNATIETINVPDNVVPTPATSLSPLVQAAMNGNLDTARLKELLEIQKQYEAKEAEKAFHLALSEFKKVKLEIYKTKEVSFGTTRYKHATLGASLAEINPVLGEHGLSLSWETTQNEKNVITVTCVLSHRLGHSKSTSLSSLPDESGGKNKIQAVGSAVHYLQRYTAFSLLGVASMDQDDDGNGTGEKKAVEPPDGYDEWEAGMIAVAGEGLEELEKAFKAANVEYRKYITGHKPMEWAELKKKARGDK